MWKNIILNFKLPHLITLYLMSFITFLLILGQQNIIVFSNWLKLNTFELAFSISLQWEFFTCLLIWFVSLCILIYSLNYISETLDYFLFYIYMGFFITSISILVIGSNIFILLIGWEGVGIVSYFLINYWNLRIEANKSSLKALLLNKIGDFCLVFAGIFLFNLMIAPKNFVVNALVPFFRYECILWNHFLISIINFIGILIVGTAITKSAQLYFCMWLPDAMEGPTPVSALIHSSTMVAAGYILLLKYYSLLQTPYVLGSICFIGLLTNLLSTITLFSTTDIKNTLANSTLAQIAYMFFLFGYGLPILSLTQFATHAFYKSLLFLSFGGLIHQLLNNQDSRLLTGLYIQNPITYSCVLIGLLNFISIPAFIAHYSKVNLLNLTITQNYGVYYGIYLITDYSQVVNFLSGLGLIWILIFNKTNLKLTKNNIFENHSWEFSNLFAVISLIILALSATLLGPFILNWSISWEFTTLGLVELIYEDLYFNPYNISNWLFLTLFLASFNVVYFWNLKTAYSTSQSSAINNWFLDKVLNLFLRINIRIGVKLTFLLQNKFFFPLTYLKLLYKF